MIGAAHLVGQSMGGYIHQIAAYQQPERVLSVAAVDSFPVQPSYFFEPRQMAAVDHRSDAAPVPLQPPGELHRRPDHSLGQVPPVPELSASSLVVCFSNHAV